YQIFFDLNDHDFPRWDESRSAFFWAHRIYQLDEDQRSESNLTSLLRLNEIRTYGLHGKAPHTPLDPGSTDGVFSQRPG
ncbi:MAG: hypothetical protein ABJM18_05380, partial [Hyphomonas sp.]|uniref:hypothetical protein n=1 Tax=Hyphomonas sp. TaxID=87 RepID=UPI00329742AD